MQTPELSNTCTHLSGRMAYHPLMPNIKGIVLIVICNLLLPVLQALKLSGMSPYAVGRTCWEALSTLTALTSLALQFIPASPLHNALTQSHQGVHHGAGEPSRETVVSLGEALPVLRLEHLPAGVQELQLANCYVGVPDTGCVRAG
jgi:hypothetical protein